MTKSAIKRLFSGPFLAFILCGTLVPLVVIAFYGFTDRSGAFTLDNIMAIAGGHHAQALGLSLALALISTLICLLLAFPLG
ncbi:MAG: ABC transporter permease, partial [Anaerovoracaceae bacterium]